MNKTIIGTVDCAELAQAPALASVEGQTLALWCCADRPRPVAGVRVGKPTVDGNVVTLPLTVTTEFSGAPALPDGVVPLSSSWTEVGSNLILLNTLACTAPTPKKESVLA